MGGCQSSEFAEQNAKSKAIDRQLAVTSTRIVQKLLLLGPGESGKSTCVKQMRILHTNGYTDAELDEKKCIVYSNTVRGMLEVVLGMTQLGMQFTDHSLTNEVKVLEKHIENNLEFSCITTAVRNAIKKLWADPSVRASFNKRAFYQCQDSLNYFFDNVDRISEKDYRPTNMDVLLTRVPTSGVVKLHFVFNDIDFNVFDVGGQRSERRKWIHFFDDMNALIFVAAISEYDQRIREDNQTNRLMEALELFDSIANSRFFEKSSMILFLNKIDLFAQKIKHVPLTITFPSYTGGLNYNEAMAYLQRQFIRLYKNQHKMYVHETCATDTNQLNHIFASVLDTIVQENLRDTGIL